MVCLFVFLRFSSWFEHFGGGKRSRILHTVQPAGVDRQRDGTEEAKTVLEVPDARVGERVPIQCLRFQAEAVGTGPEFEPD